MSTPRGTEGKGLENRAPEAGKEIEDWTAYRPSSLLDNVVDRAVRIPSGTIRKHVAGLRARNPEASPAEIIKLLEKQYLRVIQVSGGGIGAAAAVPAVGTGVSMMLSGSDIATFFGSSAAFALAVAEVHGIEVEDVPRRRALLLATVLGDKGAKDVEDAVGGSGVAWGKVLLTSMPQTTLRRVNNALTNQFIRRQLAKQGGLFVGRVIPFGIGAVIGFVGARALGQTVIAQSRSAFGPPPEHFPRIIEHPRP